jgi:hypothetical protein
VESYAPYASNYQVPSLLVRRPCSRRRGHPNGRRATLQNSSAEEILVRAVVGCDLQANGSSACRLAPESDLFGVAAEEADVVVHPV